MAIIPPRRRLTGDAPVEFMETRTNMTEGIAYVKELDRFLPEPEVEEQAKKVYVFQSIICQSGTAPDGTRAEVFAARICGKQHQRTDKGFSNP
jgi:hypothetical protein